jgi:hypothetical protein
MLINLPPIQKFIRQLILNTRLNLKKTKFKFLVFGDRYFYYPNCTFLDGRQNFNFDLKFQIMNEIYSYDVKWCPSQPSIIIS